MFKKSARALGALLICVGMFTGMNARADFPQPPASQPFARMKWLTNNVSERIDYSRPYAPVDIKVVMTKVLAPTHIAEFARIMEFNSVDTVARVAKDLHLAVTNLYITDLRIQNRIKARAPFKDLLAIFYQQFGLVERINTVFNQSLNIYLTMVNGTYFARKPYAPFIDDVHGGDWFGLEYAKMDSARIDINQLLCEIRHGGVKITRIQEYSIDTKVVFGQAYIAGFGFNERGIIGGHVHYPQQWPGKREAFCLNCYGRSHGMFKEKFQFGTVDFRGEQRIPGPVQVPFFPSEVKNGERVYGEMPIMPGGNGFNPDGLTPDRQFPMERQRPTVIDPKGAGPGLPPQAPAQPTLPTDPLDI